MSGKRGGRGMHEEIWRATGNHRHSRVYLCMFGFILYCANELNAEFCADPESLASA